MGQVEKLKNKRILWLSITLILYAICFIIVGLVTSGFIEILLWSVCEIGALCGFYIICSIYNRKIKELKWNQEV